jgi:hypothetical protein
MNVRAFDRFKLCLPLLALACSRVDGGKPDEGAGAGTGQGGTTVMGSGGSNPGGGSAGTTLTTGGSAGMVAMGGSAGTTVTTGGQPPVIEGKPTLANGRGATVPWVEYEAEDGVTTGTVIGPTRNFTEIAAEASGRRAVRLDQTGQQVSVTATEDFNSIVVRYSIPDSGDGQGMWATLGVYVNDELRARLDVTSRYSWTYGNHDHFTNPDQNSPGLGVPHHYFDESRALIGDVPEGATVTVRKDGEATAAWYVVDLIDLEYALPPLPMPDGFVSALDCGATPDDDSDDSAALRDCVVWARDTGKGLYLPPGRFLSTSQPISVDSVTVAGAGMWHTVVSGFYAHFDCWGGGNCKYRDFSVFGDTVRRVDADTDTAFGGAESSGVELDRIWMEHSKTGYWPGTGTDGLVIKNSRIRNLFADGVNLFSGTKNSVIENNHLRNTGDDAIAMWSPGDGGVSSGNVVRHNYVQLPWMANCFGVYGGTDNTIEENVCADTVQYPGVLLARQFNSHPFAGNTSLSNNTLIRAGGSAYDQAQGALKLHAEQGTIQNIQITGMDILDSTHSAIHFQGESTINTVYIDGVNVDGAGNAFFLNWGANGAADAANVVVQNAGGVQDDASGAFQLLKGTGNVGW